MNANATQKQIAYLKSLLDAAWMQEIPEAKRTALRLPAVGNLERYLSRLTTKEASAMIDALTK